MTLTYRADPALSRRAASRLERGFRAAGWTPTVGDDWNLDWIQGPPDREAFDRLGLARAINHFPGFAAFGHKGHLHRNLSAAGASANAAGYYDFHPRSFSMPEDRSDWAELAAAEPGLVWIVKPPRGGQGEGISLVTDPALVPTDGEWVVQEYIDRPHLIDGRKYVLRVWVLVTSLDPLICYIHENGVFKMTARPFRSVRESADDLPTHLTNPSVQRADREVPLGSLNSDLHGYRRRLKAEGVDPGPMFNRIRDVVVQSIIACRDQALAAGRGLEGDLDGCFELLGPDILIDEDLNPWVLELNTFPSLEVSRDAEPEAATVVRAAKDDMVADMAWLLRFGHGDPPPRAGGFQLAWPAADASSFSPCFPLLRPRDRELASRACMAVSPLQPALRPAKSVQARPYADGLALIRDDGLYVLNDVGAVAWLCLADGLTPHETIDEIASAFPLAPRRRIAGDVWDLMSAWARAGLITGFESTTHREGDLAESTPTTTTEGTHGSRRINRARSA